MESEERKGGMFLQKELTEPSGSWPSRCFSDLTKKKAGRRMRRQESFVVLIKS